MANGRITYAQKRVAPKASYLPKPCSAWQLPQLHHPAAYTSGHLQFYLQHNLDVVKVRTRLLIRAEGPG